MACEKDYSKGLIYTIKTNDGLYVGSTIDFKARENRHRSSIHNENCKKYNLKLYKNIRENGCDLNMELYKLFPCNNERELEQEEERIRIELNANLNGRRAYSTEEEKKEYKKKYDRKYREKNRDVINARQKLYDEKNRDRINEKKREKVTCECGCKLTRKHIARHRKTKIHLNRMKELDIINS